MAFTIDSAAICEHCVRRVYSRAGETLESFSLIDCLSLPSLRTKRDSDTAIANCSCYRKETKTTEVLSQLPGYGRVADNSTRIVASSATCGEGYNCAAQMLHEAVGCSSPLLPSVCAKREVSVRQSNWQPR